MGIKTNSKVVHTELKKPLSKRFELIKDKLGMQNDAEVIRFLIQEYYSKHYSIHVSNAQTEIKNDRHIIQEFMEKYGEEWRKLGEDE